MSQIDFNIMIRDPTEIVSTDHEKNYDILSTQFKERNFQFSYYVKNLALSSFPIAISYLCHSLTEFICLCILAKDDSAAVGSVAVGMMICNSGPFSFLYGVADGVGTLVSQAHGANEEELCGKYLNKGIVIQLAILLPWILIMGILNYFLEYIGYSEEDSLQMGIYLRVASPYLIFYGLTEEFRRFLTSIQIFKIESIIYSISLAASIGYSLLFIRFFHWKTYGAALAMDFLGLTECSLFALYIFFSKNVQPFNAKFSTKVFKDWGPFLKLSIPNSIISATRSSTEAFVELAAGIISSLQLEIQSCCLMIVYVLFSSIFGLTYAMYSYVGNSLGAQDANQAKTWCKVSIAAGNIVFLIEILICFFFEDTLIDIFFEGENKTEGEKIIKNLNLLIALFFFLKCNLYFFKVLFSAIGRQWMIVSGSIVISLGMIFFSIIFAFDIGFGLEIYGLWIGICVNLVGCLIFYLYRLPKNNWEVLVEEAMGRIAHAKHN